MKGYEMNMDDTDFDFTPAKPSCSGCGRIGTRIGLKPKDIKFIYEFFDSQGHHDPQGLFENAATPSVTKVKTNDRSVTENKS